MDPEVTLQRLERAIQTRDFSVAVESLNNYYQWRLKGGAGPVQGDARADILANHLVDAMEQQS